MVDEHRPTSNSFVAIRVSQVAFMFFMIIWMLKNTSRSKIKPDPMAVSLSGIFAFLFPGYGFFGAFIFAEDVAVENYQLLKANPDATNLRSCFDWDSNIPIILLAVSDHLQKWHQPEAVSILVIDHCLLWLGNDSTPCRFPCTFFSSSTSSRGISTKAFHSHWVYKLSRKHPDQKWREAIQWTVLRMTMLEGNGSGRKASMFTLTKR